MKPWLVRILVNAVLSQQRRRTHDTVSLDGKGPDIPDADAVDPAVTLDALESRLELRRAIASLSPDHRQVVALRYFAGLTVPEAARALGTREGTVKSRLHRALALLRQQLDDSGFETSVVPGRSSTGSVGG